jgi:P2-related tail formation protein
MARYDLLPPNATQFERDMSRAISSLRGFSPYLSDLLELEDEAALGLENSDQLGLESSGPRDSLALAVPVIRTAKRINIPDSVVPWLIWEYGLGEILPYLPDMRQALAQGIAWQRIRGTPQSITLALSWIGITGLVEESEANTYRWAEYQLGLSAPTQGDAIIDQIAGVTRISNPVRSRLQRIYAVYDLRRAVYDQCSWSDGSIYSDHSGVRPRPDWPQISYGQFTTHLVEEATQAYHSLTEILPLLVEYVTRFRYDEDSWDEGWHDLNLPGTITETIGQSSGYIGQSWAAFAWRDVSWADAGPIVHDANWETVPSTTVTWIPGLGAIGVQSDSADLG